MSFISLILIAFGLSMDAFAVSVSNGILIKDIQIKHMLKIALFFGAFQAIMPVIGWLIGARFSTYVMSIGHWVAFAVLAILGIKMIYCSFKTECTDDGCGVCKNAREHLSSKALVMLAVATSIDALAVGVSFSFLNVSIYLSALLIGLITFFICFAGVALGKQSGSLFKNKAEILGGAILTLIGFKILIENMDMSLLLRYLSF